MASAEPNLNLFGKLVKKCSPPNSAVEERRHDDTIYSLGAHLIPNLIKSATEILQHKVDSGELDEMPLIPIKEWVRLQFVPNAAERDIAGKFTGRLNVK